MSSPDFLDNYYRDSGGAPAGRRPPGALEVLMAFSELQHISLPMSEIAAWLMISASDARRLVRGLREERLVSVARSPGLDEDIIELTNRGKSILRRLKGTGQG